MLFGTIDTNTRLDYSGSRFQRALAFLKREDLAELPEGWIELGDGVRASVQHYTTLPANELLFETHERFFDVQYLVEGTERIGVCARKDLAVKVLYDMEGDITFYHEPTFSGDVLLCAGDYVVLAPEDAHKPRCIAGQPMKVKKIVVKVPV